MASEMDNDIDKQLRDKRALYALIGEGFEDIRQGENSTV